MYKKIVSILLILLIINYISLPVFANNENPDTDRTADTEFEIEANTNKAYDESHKTNRIIDAEFKTELNVNKASKGQIVQFISKQDCILDNFTIPKGTIYEGEVRHFKKGRWGYRRAKVIIRINKIILPNGETYPIKAFTKKHVLKGSALGNTAKGVVSFPIAIATGTVGVVVILVEAISIVGIILIGPTTYAFGRAMDGLTHGVNCKKHEGDEVQLKVIRVKKRVK